MLIDCPGCGASYHITKSVLTPNGRRVACPRCDTVWLAKPKQAEAFADDLHLSADDRLSPVPHADYARTRLTPATPAPRRRLPAFVPNFFAGALLLAVAMGLIASRQAVARAWPGAGRLYAAMGMSVARHNLVIRHLRCALTRVDGVAYLGITGEIVNLQAEKIILPPVRLAVRDAGKHDLYTWTVAAGRRSLAPGASLTFHARLAEPPAAGRDIAARFVATEEMAAR